MWDLKRDICFSFEQPATPGSKSEAADRVRSFALKKEDGETLVICCADFSLSSQHDATSLIGSVGQGRVYGEVLNSLLLATNSARDCFDNVTVLWATHFPPCIGEAMSKQHLALIDDCDLLCAAADASIAAILAGHVHHTFDFNAVRDGKPSVKIFCSGPATGLSEHGKYAFSILDIETTQGRVNSIRSKPYAWDSNLQDFQLSSANSTLLPDLHFSSVTY